MLSITNTERGVADYEPFSRELQFFDTDYLGDWAGKHSANGVSLTNSVYDLGASDALYRALGMERKQQPVGATVLSPRMTSLLPVITNPGSIGPADLASASSSPVLTVLESAIHPASPEVGGFGVMEAAQNQASFSETFSGYITIGGTVTATSGSKTASETFSGSVGVVIIADINSSGTGTAQEIGSGDIK